MDVAMQILYPRTFNRLLHSDSKFDLLHPEIELLDHSSNNLLQLEIMLKVIAKVGRSGM